MTRGRPPTGRKNVTTTMRPSAIAAIVDAFGMPAAAALRILGESLADCPTPEQASVVVQVMLYAKQISINMRELDARRFAVSDSKRKASPK